IFRLLRRQEFFRNWIGFISPRSQLAAALQTRVVDIQNLNDPFEIDGVKLRRGSGEPFDYGPHGNAQSIAYFFGSKSHTSNYAAGGVVLQVSDEALMFLGIRSELLSLASLQDFSRINDYSFNAGTETQFIECVLSKTKYEAFVLPPSVMSSAKEANGNMSFQLKGAIQYAKSGLVFGVLPLG
ncbi:MAG: hypothetical protein ABIR76_04305, partial [Polaromonas sp.]